jgi:hypothetical protein
MIFDISTNDTKVDDVAVRTKIARPAAGAARFHLASRNDFSQTK